MSSHVSRQGEERVGEMANSRVETVRFGGNSGTLDRGRVGDEGVLAEVGSSISRISDRVDTSLTGRASHIRGA